MRSCGRERDASSRRSAVRPKSRSSVRSTDATGTPRRRSSCSVAAATLRRLDRFSMPTAALFAPCSSPVSRRRHEREIDRQGEAAERSPRPAMKLFLVRHGESTWNAEGRYQGRRDAPLSALGVKQAEALGRRLASVKADRPSSIVSSPLSRALTTARTVGDLVGCTPGVDQRLVEIGQGDWEGTLVTDVQQRWPDLFRTWRANPELVSFPGGGESLAAARKRWRSFAVDLMRYDSPLLVVTHDVIVRLAVLDARGEELAQFRTVHAENAAITQLEIEHGAWRVVRLNDGTHLLGLSADASRQAL